MGNREGRKKKIFTAAEQNCKWSSSLLLYISFNFEPLTLHGKGCLNAVPTTTAPQQGK